MRSTIQQWGNSLALRLPKPFADEAGLARNAQVDISLVQGNIVILPVKEPQPTLAELLAEVTEENRHSEVDTGPAVGREVW